MNGRRLIGACLSRCRCATSSREGGSARGGRDYTAPRMHGTNTTGK
ncbi:hypothetical protein C4K05_3150 [Pseudomonas chlororaphis subsp. aureofaciens]|uniref:Uncharacterized protein n=1 Tax=Pseudomonas chlororaphis subsp. aureofaciens TaxID=587851 RepID=A0AAD0ZEN1_9PSED|nr:hypothetical protein C4K08_3121 [Pseudomonas chlororaphis subsp. aureofaciens]AZE29842.1 hypothetical protein C4K07_3057 [Pseudomonas chlororaphis subsp. aureofaciens]AZE36145.1 hypothetical protein C4K06_3112 [Pseudomonas chlororaphis subsp. aureofaciens]AZE42490.1 hypothetical protein C4K05_3150 [Pseudomonas chlororaphis subsp. aureofaciens]